MGGGYQCSVRSRTHLGLCYDVGISVRKGWTCKCDMYAKGRKICAHIVASFTHLSAGSVRSDVRGSGADTIPERLPEQWCTHCGNTNCAYKEKRHLKKMSESKECKDDDDGSTICRCNTCGRTFADRPGFAGRHYSERVILMVLMYIARGMSPADAARTVNEECDTKVTERTARRWASDYPRMITAYTDGLKLSNVAAVSVDEKHYKTRGKDRWMYKAICLKSRFIIAVHHFGDKLVYDATNFFKTIVERLGMAPLLVLNDRLRGFLTGHKNVFKTDPPSTLYVRDQVIIESRYE